MNHVKIEKNVPMGPATKYPFKDMKVGDSLLDTVDGPSNKSLLRAAALTWGRVNGVKFSARRVEGGVRVWRIE